MLLPLLLSSYRCHAQVSLYTAVDLALRNSAGVRLATADVQKAAAVLAETRDVYIPNFALGSGLGYSYGFPVGQPSIYNVTSQSLLFTFSQPDYVRSARSALKAAQLALEDTRQQVILDTALDYIQLDSFSRQLAALEEESRYASRLSGIEQQRVDAGLEGRIELTRARLTAARIRLKQVHLENEAAALRETLAHLTGLPAANFVTSPQSIPAAPEYKPQSDPNLAARKQNHGVQAAFASAQSKLYVAFGDKRQNFRPQIGFAAQYNRYARFNNYDVYYSHFQSNNFGIGVQITLPLFDASKRAKARESMADAHRAQITAEQLSNQSDEHVLRLQNSLAELSAQAEVAALQSELAQNQLDSVVSQLESGSGSSTAAPLSPRDEQMARMEERQRFEDSLDAQFQLTRAQLTLLRALGGVEDWAKSAPR